MTTTNKCHRCGATSYKPVIKRDDSGTLKPSSAHQFGIKQSKFSPHSKCQDSICANIQVFREVQITMKSV